MRYADEGTPKYTKNDTLKALQCTHHIVLLGYATIKLVKLKIINDTVTSITGRQGKLQRILSDAFKCIEARLSYVRSKSQQVWLLLSTLDRGEPCSDELLAPWLFQGQQILWKTRVGLNRDQRHL